MIVVYIIIIIYILSFIVPAFLRWRKCHNCPYKYPGCDSEVMFTTMSECYADRVMTKEEREELRRKIDELD